MARYGDGELKLMHGEDSLTQVYNDDIASELQAILRRPQCLIGMPYVHPKSPRKKYWEGFMSNHSKYLSRDGEYESSFITRMDEAPWIDTNAYKRQVRSLWYGKDVTLVRGSGSLTGGAMHGAKSVREVLIPIRDAYRQIDKIEKEIGEPPFVILCAGAVATLLANKLASKGVHAVDLGYVGKFM